MVVALARNIHYANDFTQRPVRQGKGTSLGRASINWTGTSKGHLCYHWSEFPMHCQASYLHRSQNTCTREISYFRYLGDAM